MFLLLGLVLFTAVLCWTVWENTALSLERVEVPITGLPAEFEGFTIVQITDIHGRRFDPDGYLVRSIKAARPDIIVATGDFVDEKLSEFSRIAPLFEAVSAVAPTYAVSGNHDYRAGWPEIARKLRECGVIVLENEHVRLVNGSAELIIAGVSDPVTRRHDLEAAVPEEASGPVILLAHAPHLHRWLSEGRNDGQLMRLRSVSLALVGHTHGGQIRLPLIGAVTNGSGQPFPRSYVAGLSREGSGWLYISRGLGYTILPLRFLSRPEVSVITLRKGP